MVDELQVCFMESKWVKITLLSHDGFGRLLFTSAANGLVRLKEAGVRLKSKPY